MSANVLGTKRQNDLRGKKGGLIFEAALNDKRIETEK
jgi:hypothetical protein